MADFKFRGDLAANQELVCSISSLLNAHNIPNLFWGDLVFNLYGVPLHVSQCPRGSQVPRLPSWPDMPRHPAKSLRTPPTYAHFNIKQKGDPRKWFRVELHRKSDLLWTAPAIPACAPDADDPHYMIANDARLPEFSPRELLGRMDLADCPVKIPTPDQFAEALAMLYYRDGVPGPTIRGAYWLELQSELVQTGLVKLDELPARIKRHYELVGKANINEVHRYSEEVAGQMREEFEIPVRMLPPDTDAFEPAEVVEFL
ncbi:hypothetical protein ALT_2757 [Aspergillus lentulus]|uniref:Uncharacterized protein n=1 Tax=Aspergillus lentulus TaxID=293939 RepID=A0AAN4T903_ASPLE|nr:hypothetical protein ALT_2757 [Aspergillus lentulus]